MNAYDPEEWRRVPPIEPAAFDLAYTGTFYGGKRRPDVLFEAIRRLIDVGDPAGIQATVRFYGRENGPLLETAQRR